MEVGDFVTVRPSASLRYGKRRGKIVAIKTSELPIQVEFENKVMLYFHPSELLTDRELSLWNKPVFCAECGKGISEELSSVCESCFSKGEHVWMSEG